MKSGETQARLEIKRVLHLLHSSEKAEEYFRRAVVMNVVYTETLSQVLSLILLSTSKLILHRGTTQCTACYMVRNALFFFLSRYNYLINNLKDHCKCSSGGWDK